MKSVTCKKILHRSEQVTLPCTTMTSYIKTIQNPEISHQSPKAI